ncbi:MAG: DNA adenine methylase, partial [Deltaproteobacteria bacterium]|nr:DNA adenine methylase [Deltaproteobacteria bacterium]
MIKYLGSKRVLIPALVKTVTELPDVRTFLDVFSGTARVGQAMKEAGLRVRANDHNAYAHVLAQCYVGADKTEVEPTAERLIAQMATVPPRPGYVTETFCENARYFHPKNGARIDALRDHIEALALPPPLRAVLLVSLMEAADRVDSTTGVQMAYLKQWAPRAHNDLELRMPRLLPGPGDAHGLDALELVQQYDADVVYLDPPYNQHSYLGNYHVWETLVRWDAPETYGIANKRIDCKERRSPFNSKRKFQQAMREVVEAVRARWLLVSFNNEGYISREQMVAMLGERGEVQVQAIEHDRYVGA